MQFPDWNAEDITDAAATTRRGLLQGVTAAATLGGVAYASPTLAVAMPAQGLSHSSSLFGPIDTSGFPPLDSSSNIQITALDFARGLSDLIESMINLAVGIKNALVAKLLEFANAIIAANAGQALVRLSEFRGLVVSNTASLNAAAGFFSFSAVASFTQAVLVQVDWLLTLGAQVVLVIFDFTTGQLFKIVQAFSVLTTWFTATVITQWHVYAHYYLFLLAIRFQQFPGPAISIDIYELYICICLQLTVTQSVTLCMTEVRTQLLLVDC